jgi:hypothetical protein
MMVLESSCEPVSEGRLPDQKDMSPRGIPALNPEKSTPRNTCQTSRGKEQAMDRVQGISQEIPAERNTRRGFARGMALLWKARFSILTQEERSMLSQEKGCPIYIPRGTTTHAGGKLVVATRSAPHKIRGEAYCIGYIDAFERSYGVYQIHLKTAFFSGKFPVGSLFVLDNDVFREHEAWSGL